VRVKRVLPAVIAAFAAAGAAVALAAHPQVDPATVPTGFLTAHTRVNDVPTAVLERALRSRRTDVFLQHARLNPTEAGPFHTHPGPAFVTVVAGSLINEEEVRGRCRVKTYVRGTGFVDPGRGRVHRLRGGPEGADFYITSLLPRGTGPNETPAANAACGR
jgi:quercetin dioxygenase-like cupin family protein